MSASSTTPSAMPRGNSGSRRPAMAIEPPRLRPAFASAWTGTWRGLPGDAPADGVGLAEPVGSAGLTGCTPAPAEKPGAGVRAPAGVGSNATQPTPEKYSSGQACASWVLI